jgi:methionine-gamma-lyase
MDKGFSTTLIHRGERQDGGALTTPIYETTTFVFESAEAVERYNEGKSSGYLYSRYENPTVVATEEKLAAADGAEAAVVFSSGMAATTNAILTFVKAGEEVV